MQGDLTALIERVEKATGPDRKLDCLLDCIQHDRKFIEWTADTGVTGYRYARPHIWGSGAWREEIAYTSSLDAALALVEEKLPGVYWHIARGKTRPSEPLFGAELVTTNGNQIVAVEHDHSAPLALILALLRALQSQQENSEVKDAG